MKCANISEKTTLAAATLLISGNTYKRENVFQNRDIKNRVCMQQVAMIRTGAAPLRVTGPTLRRSRELPAAPDIPNNCPMRFPAGA